jgi:hypothetical protein
MKTNQEGLIRLGSSILGVLTLSSGLLSPALFAQARVDSEAAIPATSDWSQHHVIFSRPANAEQAESVQHNVRYWQQQDRQPSASLPHVEGGLASELQSASNASHPGKNPKLNRDWAQDLGSGASVGAGNYPAKFSFSPATANCASAHQPDFVVYGTNLAGSTTQASIAAYDNLYSGCSGTVPMVYWAYNTGGTVTTSPVFSGDGTQIAFVQTDGSGHGNLVLVRWAASATESIGNPLTLTRLANTSYPGCTAPCMTSTVLTDSSGNPHGDTNSSVFYDYSDDIAFVGDNAGWLHKITPVFNGVPAEVRSAGWPVQVNPGAPTALTSPVYDGTSGRAFVADAGGFLYRVGPGTAFVAVSSGPLDVSSAEGGAGIVQGPIVDSTAELVYVFASADGSGHCVGGADCAAVYQLPVNFPSGDIGQKTVVGASTIFGKAIPSPLYIGGFDSAYENSVNATGNLYVCGNTGGPPIFYQVPITAAAFSASNPLTFLSNSTTPCSPVTHILNPNASNGPTEWIFASVQKSAVSNLPGCAASASGCIYNAKVTPWQPSTAYAVGQEVLDSHFQIQVVETAGTSNTSAPAWSVTTGGITTDNSVTWLDQGLLSATIVKPAWEAHTSYSVGNIVFDTNGNIELCIASTGKSGGTVTWMTAPGAITIEPKVTWENLGADGTAALAAAGGTSGIIIDNTVSSGGASQVYFSTLSSQPCGTSGAGGCAIQASQSVLQ